MPGRQSNCRPVATIVQGLVTGVQEIKVAIIEFCRWNKNSAHPLNLNDHEKKSTFLFFYCFYDGAFRPKLDAHGRRHASR